MSPDLHAILLAAATVSAIVFAGVILARSRGSMSGRLHAVYGAAVAWWFATLAMIAMSDNPEAVTRMARFAHLGIAMLPGIIYHLNVATAGVAHERRQRIRAHYAVSVALTAYALLWPPYFAAPYAYAWGPYPAFTPWALPLLIAFAVVFVEVLALYRMVARRHRRGSPANRNARTLFGGNAISTLALVDALPAFGVAIYPFGFIVLTLLNIATAVGTIRYRLLEIRPSMAADRILDTIADGFVVVDDQGLIRLANDAASRLLGHPSQELIDRQLAAIAMPEALRAALESVPDGDDGSIEIEILDPAGLPRSLVVSGRPLPDEWGAPFARVLVIDDVTEQRTAQAANEQLESSIRQVQKLETIGVMAGGIAHDFNNILAVIGGNADLARMHAETGQPIDDDLRAIAVATERATDLTRQMLTYAGRGTSARNPVDLNGAVREMANLLATAVSKKATLQLELAEELPAVLGDEGQIRQVLLNLITNASEAMNDRPGRITVRTAIAPAEATIRRLLPEEGTDEPSVILEVSDTGAGMDDTTRARIFDPFFTTKFTGRGLGLATVVGIVKGHGGVVEVESAPGIGSRFTVVLPAMPGVRPADKAPAADPTGTWRSAGHAIVADDEPEVRRVAAAFLHEAGFEVLEVGDGRAAVERFRERRAEIDLVVLDVTMPEMGGREAFRAIRSMAPDVPVVFMSGYPQGSDPGESAARTAFLGKPFTLASMAMRVNEAMRRND